MISCPCGQEHESAYEDQINAILDAYGATQEVLIPGLGVFEVPRVYTAIHGIKAWELPELANKYGWKHELV